MNLHIAICLVDYLILSHCVHLCYLILPEVPSSDRLASQFAFMNLVSSFLQFLFCLELTLDLLTGLYIEIWVMVLAES